MEDAERAAYMVYWMRRRMCLASNDDRCREMRQWDEQVKSSRLREEVPVLSLFRDAWWFSRSNGLRELLGH